MDDNKVVRIGLRRRNSAELESFVERMLCSFTYDELMLVNIISNRMVSEKLDQQRSTELEPYKQGSQSTDEDIPGSLV